jgi:MoaA/NifB/PqqE/SkfB family radical SAM enzyme
MTNNEPFYHSVWTSLGFPSSENYHFPSFVNIEVFRGACPCRCIHCPVGVIKPSERSARFGIRGMDLDLYDRITAEVGKYPWATARVHAVGEPLVWDHLVQALELGARNHARTWVFTSAVSSDPALFETMSLHAAVIEVSVNSTNADDYRRTKGVDAFEQVLGNVRALARPKRRDGCPRLVVSRVQSLDPAADEAFIQWWRSSGLVDDVFVRSYHSYNDMLRPQLDKGSPPQEPRAPCLVHWARFNINVSGLAVVCFNELFKEAICPDVIVGNLRESSIAELWRGPKLSALREAELAGKTSAVAPELPCATCRFCQPLGGTRNTSEHQIIDGTR